MSSNQYDDSEEEAQEAQDRINQILGGGSGTDSQQGYEEDPLGGTPRVQLRSRAARSALGVDDRQQGQMPSRQGSGGRAPAGRARQALVVIGGIVALGVLVVAAIFGVAMLNSRGGSIALPFFPTATPTFTPTPLPTSTPTPTATVPPLQLPNLTCLVQTTTGCLDYCQTLDNLKECDQARSQVEAQGADFTVFLKCVAPAPGPNTGNPQKCLEDAYRARHP